MIHTGPLRAHDMMFYTTKYPDISKPCDGECRYNGPVKRDDSLCMVCGMTPEEKCQWPLLSDSRQIKKALEVNERVGYMWMMWEIMEEPTLQ